MSIYIAPLEQITIADAQTYGGKAASLGHMATAGLPIPRGFAISAEASRSYRSGIDDQFRNELVESFRELGCTRVAVRSSALAEDGEAASWAGQLESYLNVTEESLIQAVEDCWRSIDAEHAVEYARDKNVSEHNLAVGVVVIEMVDSEVSGVMFTQNPIDISRDTMLIESLYGLGEMLVQGLVTPDRFEVSRSSGEIVSYDIGVKKQQMCYVDGKNTVIDVDAGKLDVTTLFDDGILRLAELGKRIETLYGSPQDIEWAYSNDNFYIVQARPITTL